MNLYCDLTTLKSASVADFASVTTHDVYLLALLEAASRSIDSYCGREFFVKTATRYFDGVGLALLFGKEDLLQVSTFKTDEDGNGVYERTMAAGDYNLYPLNDIVKTWAEISYDSDFSFFAYGIPKGVEITGQWGYGDGLSVTPYKASGTTINEELDASETEVDVVSGAALAAGQTILIETEQMYIESISSNTLTVIRGVNGTTATTHATGKAVSIYKYPKLIQVATILQAIRWFKRPQAPYGIVNNEFGNANVRRLDPDVQMICDLFKKMPI